MALKNIVPDHTAQPPPHPSFPFLSSPLPLYCEVERAATRKRQGPAWAGGREYEKQSFFHVDIAQHVYLENANIVGRCLLLVCRSCQRCNHASRTLNISCAPSTAERLVRRGMRQHQLPPPLPLVRRHGIVAVTVYPTRMIRFDFGLNRFQRHTGVVLGREAPER